MGSSLEEKRTCTGLLVLDEGEVSGARGSARGGGGGSWNDKRSGGVGALGGHLGWAFEGVGHVPGIVKGTAMKKVGWEKK